MRTLKEIFENPPEQWGLRGDPHLWDEMARELSATPFPETAYALQELLESEFHRLVGVPVTHAEFVFLPKFDHGGMSGGGIAPEFWRETGLPLLVDRYRARKFS